MAKNTDPNSQSLQSIVFILNNSFKFVFFCLFFGNFIFFVERFFYIFYIFFLLFFVYFIPFFSFKMKEE